VKKHSFKLTSRLLWIDANSIVGDDGRRGRIHFEFFSRKLENGRERRGFRDTQPRIFHSVFFKKRKRKKDKKTQKIEDLFS
jgi:hypothetical protein